ncbi:hypothetical protein EON65_34365 [archaeon]|nr:MAG: hypothetical protein EON65_34365 [archaeon]
MTYFLSGAIRNECSTNPHCLESDTTTYRYQDIQDQYGYHMDLYRCVIVICVLGMVQKCVWFCMLRVYELSRRRAVRRGVMAITKRARGLLQASYRLSERMSNFTSSTVNKLEAEALAELEM